MVEDLLAVGMDHALTVVGGVEVHEDLDDEDDARQSVEHDVRRHVLEALHFERQLQRDVQDVQDDQHQQQHVEPDLDHRVREEHADVAQAFPLSVPSPHFGYIFIRSFSTR